MMHSCILSLTSFWSSLLQNKFNNIYRSFPKCVNWPPKREKKEMFPWSFRPAVSGNPCALIMRYVQRRRCRREDRICVLYCLYCIALHFFDHFFVIQFIRRLSHTHIYICFFWIRPLYYYIHFFILLLLAFGPWKRVLVGKTGYGCSYGGLGSGSGHV
jgi:hypothetical protein